MKYIFSSYKDIYFFQIKFNAIFKQNILHHALEDLFVLLSIQLYLFISQITIDVTTAILVMKFAVAVII